MNIKRGFTLVEVLVSVAIIALLASVVTISIGNAKKKAAFTRASIEADQIATGALLYYQTNEIWPTDIGNGLNAAFYNSTYVPVTGIMVQEYLGPDYKWDWQNWGNDFVNGNVFPAPVWPYTTYSNACWQSVDLYRYDPSFGQQLVLRECLRNACLQQKYCDENGKYWNTAAARDGGDTSSSEYVGLFKSGGVGNYSSVCEECSNETECAKKFK